MDNPVKPVLGQQQQVQSNKQKSNKKEPGKVATTFGFLIILGVIILVIWGIVAAFSSHKTPKKSTVASAVTKQTTQKPTESLAALNAQAVSLFNPVMADLEQQMAIGQADAQESNAGNVNSAFHAWETNESDKQNVANNNEVTKAYNSADNAYYSAHQTAPNALNNWDNDAGNLPGDISGWANAEQTVLGDEVMGSSSLSSDQKAATTALQQYQSDLAKAKADIQQL